MAEPKHPSEWVREMTAEIAAERNTYRAQRDQLLEAVREHKRLSTRTTVDYQLYATAESIGKEEG